MAKRPRTPPTTPQAPPAPPPPRGGRVRCVVVTRTPLRWHGDVIPRGMTVDLPSEALPRLCELGFVVVVPMLAPRPPRPEPKVREPFPWAVADIEAAAALAATRPPKRAQDRPARQRPRRGGGASLPRWTATDAPPVR